MASINWDDPNLGVDTSFDPSQRSPNTGINGGTATPRPTFDPAQPTYSPSQPSNPTLPAGSPSAPGSFGHPVYDQIAKYFSQNNVTPTQQLVSQWGTNVDDNYMRSIAAAINKQYAKPAPTAPTTPARWDDNWFRTNIGVPNNMQDLLGMQGKIEAAGGKLNKNASGQWNGKITTPDGRIVDVMIAAGNGGTGYQWDEGLGGGAPAPGSGAGSQSNQLLQNELINRLHELKQPIDDPMRPLYELMSLARVNNLSGAPYTAGEDAAMRAHYMEPLTQARDAAQQQARERLSARGMAPTSGLLQSEYNTIDRGYETGVAQGSNDLAVRAIDEKQRRADEQLAILTQLMGSGQNARSEDNSRAQEILQIAAMFPSMDEHTLQLLLQASGEGATSPQSLVSMLSQIGNTNTNQQAVNNQNRQASQSALGQYIGYIMNALTPPRSTN